MRQPLHPIAPKLFKLRTHPYEQADVTSNTYREWFFDHDYIAFIANPLVTQFVETFKEFQPKREPASFTITNAVEKLSSCLESRGV